MGSITFSSEKPLGSQLQLFDRIEIYKKYPYKKPLGLTDQWWYLASDLHCIKWYSKAMYTEFSHFEQLEQYLSLCIGKKNQNWQWYISKQFWSLFSTNTVYIRFKNFELNDQFQSNFLLRFGFQ